MNAGHAIKLLDLLAEYATEHGRDCPREMTVLELADDLAQSLVGEVAPAAWPERLRTAVEAGFTSTSPESRLAERQRLYGLLPGEKPAN
jgi:hypothetical protein